jgi:hypothetical protein
VEVLKRALSDKLRALSFKKEGFKKKSFIIEFLKENSPQGF